MSVVERERAGLGELGLGEPALGHAEQERVGAQLVAQQREVAGEVGERRQQRRDLGVLEGGADLVVGLGDRLDCARRTGWR